MSHWADSLRGVPFPKTWIAPNVVLRAILGVCLAVSLYAADALAQNRWRIFTTLDGMPESWVSDVTVGPSGRVFLTHGDVSTFSVYDGYSFQQLPSPGNGLTVREGPTRQIWSFNNTRDSLQLLDNDKWVTYPLSGIPTGRAHLQRNAFFPWAHDRVLIMLPNKIVEFVRPTGKVNVVMASAAASIGEFTAFQPWLRGGAWVGGTRGIARLVPGADGQPKWEAFAYPKGVEARCLSILAEGSDDAYVTIGSGNEERSLWFKNGEWTELAKANKGSAMQCWAGPHKQWWQVESSLMNFRLRSGSSMNELTTVGRQSALSGRLQSVALGGTNGFYLATSLGLAQFVPAVWQTPPELMPFNEPSSAMLETSNGDFYIVFETSLLHRTRNVWTLHHMPPGYDGALHKPRDIAELSDGRVVMGNGVSLLAFDPRQRQFRPISHPAGLKIYVLQPSKNGQVWVMTSPDGFSYRLERFDGSSFHLVHDAGLQWRYNQPRSVLEANDGSIVLVPAGRGYGVIRDGKYRTVDEKDGIPDPTPLSVVEHSPGRLWFGGRDSVFEYDGKKWTTLATGFQAVRSFLRTKDGEVWVASGSGLHRYQNGSWIGQTSAEGFPPGAAYGVLQDHSGAIWATTTAGISIQHPQVDRDAPRSYLDAHKNSNQISPNGLARMVFSGTDKWRLTPSDRLLFSWRLDGGAWSPLRPETAVDLEKLSAGQQHRFEVRAYDRNGNTDSTPASFDFSVLLHWYQEPAVFLISMFGLLGLFTFGRQFTTRFRGMQESLRDRTEELNTTRRNLSQLAETAPGEIYSFRLRPDGSMCFPYASPGIVDVYGMTPDQLREDASPIFQLMAPEDRGAVEQRLSESADTMQPFQHQFRVKHPERGEIWVEAHATPEGEPDGSVLWNGFVHDITEEKAAAQKLIESQIGLQLAVQMAGLALWERGPQNTPLSVSDHFRNLFEIPAGEVWPLDMLKRVHPDDRARLIEALKNLQTPVDVLQIEYRILRPAGGVRWLQTIAQQSSRNGEIHLLGASRDITAEKEIKNQLQAQNEELEKRVQERTAQLATTNKELESFAYSVSHDLRAPLRGIDGWSLAILEDYGDQLDEQAKKWLARVRSESQRMGALIDDLLELSRLGRIEMQRQAVDLSAKAHRISQNLMLLNPGRSLEFIVAPGMKTQGDKRLLEVALTNLFSNSVKFTNGRTDATIEFGTTIHNGVECFFVRDNGVGFDMAHAANLFQPFHRLHSPKLFPGTGVGLAIVQRMVHRHGGRIWADSHPDQGATFYFTLGGNHDT